MDSFVAKACIGVGKRTSHRRRLASTELYEDFKRRLPMLMFLMN